MCSMRRFAASFGRNHRVHLAKCCSALGLRGWIVEGHLRAGGLAHDATTRNPLRSTARSLRCSRRSCSRMSSYSSLVICRRSSSLCRGRFTLALLLFYGHTTFIMSLFYHENGCKVNQNRSSRVEIAHRVRGLSANASRNLAVGGRTLPVTTCAILPGERRRAAPKSRPTSRLRPLSASPPSPSSRL
jgi:hypothetical protein